MLYPLNNIPIYIIFTLIGWTASYLTLTISSTSTEDEHIYEYIRTISVWGNLITVVCIALYRCTNNYILDYIKKGDIKNLFVNSLMIFFCLDDIPKVMEKIEEVENMNVKDIDDEIPI